MAQRDGWLAADDARTLAVRGWFGALIGNSDIHLGNAGLVLTDARPLALAPSYDMLPMALRPASTGEIVARPLEIPAPLPHYRTDWLWAAAIARVFWQRVAASEHISMPFREIARMQLHKLEAALRLFG